MLAKGEVEEEDDDVWLFPDILNNEAIECIRTLLEKYRVKDKV